MDKKEKNKTIIFSTLAWGLLAHAFRFFNVVILGETVDSLTGQFFQISSGRWLCFYLQKLFQLVFGPLLELPWFSGIICLLIIAICNILFIDIFNIKDKKNIIIVSGILPTFVSITSLFSYIFLAPLHCISMLLAVFSLKLISHASNKNYLNTIVAIILGALSMSIYQSFIGFTIFGLFIITFTKIKESDDKRELIITIIRYISSLLLILILYILINTIVLKITGEKLSDWRNVNSIGNIFTTFNINDGIKNAYKENLNTSYTNVFVGNLKYVYYIVIITIMTYYIYNVYQLVHKKKDKLKLILYILLVLVTPLVFNYTFLSYMDMPGCATTVYYYQALVFFVLIMIIERRKTNKYIKYLVLTIIIYTCIYSCYISNTNYFIAYEIELKKQSWATTLSTSIKNMDEFNNNAKVILISSKDNQDDSCLFYEIEDDSYNNELITNYYPLMNFYSKLEISHNYIDKWTPLKLYYPTKEEENLIKNNSQYQNMPLYPEKKSIQYFSEYDAIIVKLK